MVKVYKKGSTDLSDGYNFDVPTNPRITTTTSSPDSDITDSNARLFGAVYEDGSEVGTYDVVSGATNLGDTYDNLANTEGYRIKCYDYATSTGIQLNGITDLETRYYFVLIHSDDANLHHFARITSINKEDVDGASFDFTPKLGNAIPKNTKFMLFKGSVIATTKAVAFTAGIKESHQTKMYCARPLFYFIDDLDKKNELNHNTKYMFRFRGADVSSSSSVTLDQRTSTFVTCSDFGNSLIDYSRFELKISLTDKLKDIDFTNSSVTYQEGTGTTTNDITGSYGDVFPHARRIDDDDLTSRNNLGKKRYLHYDFSRTASNILPNVYQGEVLQSNLNRGSFAESKIVDSFRIMPKKVTENELFRIRQTVHSGNLTDWIDTGLTLGTYDSANNRYPFAYGISTSLLPTNTQVKVGNRICIIDTIGSGYVTIDKSRLETESTFTTSLSLAQYQSIENQKLYVRSFDAENSILYSTFKPIEGRTDELYVKLSTNNVGIRYLKVTSIDTKNIFSNADNLIQLSALTLSPINTDAYDSKPFKYAIGQYEISIERFYGDIENIHSTKEQGQTIMTISGRDKFSKLLNPIINKNALFSSDIIYSSYSPLSEKTTLAQTLDTALFSSETLTFNSNVSLSAGDLLFHEDTFIGEVQSDSSNTSVTLKSKSRIQQPAGGTLQVSKLSKKQYILHKALSSNKLLESATSLDGAVDKVLAFTSGAKLNSDGTEKLLDSNNANSTVELLSGNSAVEDTNPDSNAYYITEPKSIGLDSLHSLFLTETEDRTSEKENFITVNTLIDFTILDYFEVGNNNNAVIAPYNPLTLGRVDYNFHNTNDTTFHSTILGTGIGTPNTGNVVTLSSNFSPFALSSISNPRRHHGDALYSNNGTFVGHILAIEMSHNGTSCDVILDRNIRETFSSQDFKIVTSDNSLTKTKLQHELNFINGAHLHGGKYVALLNSFQDQDSDAFSPTAFFMSRINYSSGLEQNYRTKYGNPLYRLLNIERGNYAQASSKTVTSFDKGFINYYHNAKTKINYYAEAYRNTEKTPALQTGSNNHNQILIESRGFTSVYGSNFHERPVNGSGENHPLTLFHQFLGTDFTYNPLRMRRTMTQIDPKVARMFLFINSDIQPYSNARKDSLLQSNKDLRNYNLMGITEPEISDISIEKSSAISEGKSVNYKDSSYITAIPTEDQDISSKKQFSIMRLTELVFDWAFNQIDPENIPKFTDVYPNIAWRSIRIFDKLNGSSAFSTTAVGNYSGDEISLSSNPHSGGTDNLVAGDLIVDSQGRFIGEVDSSSSGNTITLVQDAVKTDGANYYVGQLYKATIENTFGAITGHGKTDSFHKFDDAIHPLKGTVVRGTGTGEYGQGSSSAFYAAHNNKDLQANSGSKPIADDRKPNIFLPIQNGADVFMSEVSEDLHFPSRVLADINKMKSVFDLDAVSPFPDPIEGATVTISDLLYVNTNVVFLDGYSIEDGGGSSVGQGMTTPLVNGSFKMYNDTLPTAKGFITLNFRGSTPYEFAKYEDFDKQKTRTFDRDASGVIMGFKPHLIISDSDLLTFGSKTNLNNNNTFTYSIDSQSTTKKMRFLDYMDLTGCYLVSIDGKAYDKNETSVASTNSADYNPTHFFYVLSHEIDTSTTGTKHLFTLDGEIPSSTTVTFRVMQPNHTCFYPKSPNTINLNEVSPKYTKKANSEEMYDNIFDYEIREKHASETPYSGQGVMSMYVAIDINKDTDSNYVVIRDADKISQMLDDGTTYRIAVSDGETSYRTAMKYSDSGDDIGHNLYFTDIQETNGVVSISEYFNLPHNGDLSNCKRLLIGSTLDIGYEAEALVNDLIENENIVLNNSTTNDYPYLLAPNYKGVNLFIAITQLLNKKNKRLKLVEEKFEVMESESSEVYSNIILSDFGDNQIYEYEKEKSLFDFYNEIIVYGRVHKRVNKNLQSIKKVGRKTLEVYDRSLETQAEVNQKARDLLRLHSDDNEKINVVVRQKNMAQLRPSDIVNVEIRRENIPLNRYEVLQITHRLDGMMKLQLGKFAKGLEERFAELQVANANTNSAIRTEEQDANVNSFDFLENLNIKPLRVVVRKRSSSGTEKLGFTDNLGFDFPLGISGNIELTELRELEF